MPGSEALISASLQTRLALLFGFALIFAGGWIAGRHPDEHGLTLVDHFVHGGPGY